MSNLVINPSEFKTKINQFLSTKSLALSPINFEEEIKKESNCFKPYANLIQQYNSNVIVVETESKMYQTKLFVKNSDISYNGSTHDE